MAIARQSQFQQIHYLRFTVNYNDVGVAAGEPFKAALPAGAKIVDVKAFVTTAFNAATTNVITVGTNATTYNNIVASGTITPGTLGAYAGVLATYGALTFATDATPFVTYTQTGTAATAGSAIIVIQYVPNNDG